MDITRVREIIAESINVKKEILGDTIFVNKLVEVSNICVEAFKQDKKILFCGNGGSAADAQHLAAEFSGRFYSDRQPLFAEALHVNSSYLTAVANDYSFHEVYERLVKAKGREGDIIFGISTSGNSENIIKAIAQSKKQGLITIGFTGRTGGELKDHCDFLFNIPSTDTPRIQEAHIMIGHIICELVEQEMFPKEQ